MRRDVAGQASSGLSETTCLTLNATIYRYLQRILRMIWNVCHICVLHNSSPMLHITEQNPHAGMTWVPIIFGQVAIKPITEEQWGHNKYQIKIVQMTNLEWGPFHSAVQYMIHSQAKWWRAKHELCTTPSSLSLRKVQFVSCFKNTTGSLFISFPEAKLKLQSSHILKTSLRPTSLQN